MDNNLTVEMVSVSKFKHEIERDLLLFGSSIQVSFSLITEDGYDLVLVGDEGQIAHLVQIWSE
jgi:hypothetical protein